jgi:hypothetical protein
MEHQKLWIRWRRITALAKVAPQNHRLRSHHGPHHTDPPTSPATGRWWSPPSIHRLLYAHDARGKPTTAQSIKSFARTRAPTTVGRTEIGGGRGRGGGIRIMPEPQPNLIVQAKNRSTRTVLMYNRGCQLTPHPPIPSGRCSHQRRGGGLPRRLSKGQRAGTREMRASVSS